MKHQCWGSGLVSAFVKEIADSGAQTKKKKKVGCKLRPKLGHPVKSMACTYRLVLNLGCRIQSPAHQQLHTCCCPMGNKNSF